MAWKCPKCESRKLQISALVWVDLIQYGPDHFETEAQDGHEWNDMSQCVCAGCGFSGEVAQFEEKTDGR